MWEQTYCWSSLSKEKLQYRERYHINNQLLGFDSAYSKRNTALKMPCLVFCQLHKRKITASIYPVKMAIKSYIHLQETKDKSQFSMQTDVRKKTNSNAICKYWWLSVPFRTHNILSASSLHIIIKHVLERFKLNISCEFYRLEKETIIFSFCTILHLFYHCIYSRLLWKDLLTENLGAWFLFILSFCSSFRKTTICNYLIYTENTVQ